MAVTTGRRQYTNPDLRSQGILPEVIFTDKNLQEASFISFLSELPKKQVVTPIVTWAVENYLPILDPVSAPATASTSVINVTNADYYIATDIWFNKRTNEHFTVTAVDKSSNQITVIRGLGSLNGGSGTAPAAMNVGDTLIRLNTSVNPQRSSATTTRTQSLATEKQFMQAMRQDINIGREDIKNQYDLDRREWDAELEKAFKEFRKDLNRTFVFGEKAEWQEGGSTKRNMQGIYNTPKTYSKDFNGTVYKHDWDRFLNNQAFRWGSREKVLFAGQDLIASIHQMADSYVEIIEEDLFKNSRFGFRVNMYRAPNGGMLKIVEDRSISETRPGDGVIVDMDQVAYAHFSNNGINDDINIYENTTENDATDKSAYIYGQVGLVWGDEKTHSLVKNCFNGARGSSVS